MKSEVGSAAECHSRAFLAFAAGKDLVLQDAAPTPTPFHTCHPIPFPPLLQDLPKSRIISLSEQRLCRSSSARAVPKVSGRAPGMSGRLPGHTGSEPGAAPGRLRLCRAGDTFAVLGKLQLCFFVAEAFAWRQAAPAPAALPGSQHPDLAGIKLARFHFGLKAAPLEPPERFGSETSNGSEPFFVWRGEGPASQRLVTMTLIS